jgi:arsenite oxidase small subunit
MRLCAASAAAYTTTGPAATRDLSPRFYSRVQLVDEHRQPLTAGALAAGRNYVFHYPFEGTPCFLLNLGKPTARNITLRTEDGSAYEWPGGVGPLGSIVGFSAICSHRMTYPTRQISFISYQDKPGPSRTMRPNTIRCCSEQSEYDPASGARVLGGPAPQPLATILLEHDRTSGALHAMGTLGGELYNAFFAKYEMKLALDYGADRARQRVSGTTVVAALTTFCRQQVRC